MFSLVECNELDEVPPESCIGTSIHMTYVAMGGGGGRGGGVYKGEWKDEFSV